MAEYKVGSAKITVRPDLDNFRRALNRQWKSYADDFEKKNKDKLKVGINDDHLRDSIKKADTQLDGLVKRKRTIDVSARFRRKEFMDQLKSAMNDAKAGITAKADTADAEKKISKAAAKRAVKFDLDDSALDSYMRNRRQLGIATLTVSLKGDADAENRLNAIARNRDTTIRVNKIGDEKINVPGSTTANVRLSSDFGDFKRRAEAYFTARPIIARTKLAPDFPSFAKAMEGRFGDRPIKVGVTPETGAARAEFAELTKPETKHITARAHTAKAKSDLDALMVQMGTIGSMLTRATFMGGLFTAAGIGAAGALPAITAFGTALASVAQTSLVAPAGISAMASSFMALKLSTAGLFDKEGVFGEKGAMADLAGAIDEGKYSAELFESQTKGLSESVKDFLATIFEAEEGAETLYEAFKKMQLSSQDKLFEGVNAALGVMKIRLMEVGADGVRGIDTLTDHMDGLNTSFGSMIKNWAAFRFSNQGWADLNVQMLNTRGALTNMVGALDRWNVAWNNISTVGSYYLPGMAGSIRRMTTNMAEWSIEARRSGDMARYIDNGIKSAKNIGEASAGVFRIMGDVLEAAGVNARGMSDQLRSATESVEAFTSSTAGRASMIAFFKDAKATGSEMAQTLTEIGRVIAVHVTPMLSEFVQGLGPGLREAIGDSTRLLDAIKPSMRGIGEALGSAAVGVQSFGDMAAPLVREILPVLTGAFKVLAPAVGALAGPTVTLMAFAAGLKKLQPVGAAIAYMFSGPGGLAKGFLATGVAVTSVLGIFDDVLGWVLDFNDALGGVPAKLITFAALAKTIGMNFKAWNLATHTAAVKGMGAASAVAAGQVTALGAAQRRAATATGFIGPQMTRMGQAAHNARKSWSGLTSSMKAAPFKTMVSPINGVASALGGWPVVLGMAAVAIGTTLYSAHKKNNEVTEKAADLARSNGEAQKRMSEDMLDGASGVQAASNSLDLMREKLQEIADVGGSRSEGYQSAIDSLDNIGLSSDELAEKISGTDAEFKKFLDTQVRGREGGRLLVEQLTAQRDAYDELDSALRKLSPEQKKAYELFREIGESSGEAEGSLNKAREATMLLNGSQMAAVNASAELTNSLSTTTARLDDFSGAALDANGNIDTTTSAGSALHQEMLSLGDSIGSAVEQGMSVDSAFGQAAGTMTDMSERSGILGADWDNLLEKYQMTPERIETLMVLKTSDALLALDGFLTSIGSAQDQGKESITLRLEDDEAREIAETFGVKLNKIADKTYTARLDANNQPALDAMQRGMDQLHVFDQLEAKPFIGAEKAGLSQAVLEAMEELGIIDAASPTALANLNIDDLDAQKRLALASLINLRTMEVSPEADLYIDQLLTKAGYSRDEIDRMKKVSERPINLDANGKPAREEMTGVKDYWEEQRKKIPKAYLNAEGAGARGEMNNVREHWKNMTLEAKDIAVRGRVSVIYQGQAMSANRAQALERQGKSSDFTGPVLARGGRYPGYAKGDRHNGYRLPASGPGTEVTDGFMAYDRFGMPAARLDKDEWIINGEMSEKYNKELAAINAGTFPKVPGFAAGGIMGAGGDFLSGLLSGASGGPKGSVGAPVLPGLGIPDPFTPLVTAWDTTQATLSEAWTEFTGIAQTSFNTIQQGISTPWQQANGDIVAGWTNTASFLGSEWDNFQGQTAAVWGNVQGTITSQWNTAKDNIASTYHSGIVPVFNALQGSLDTVQASFGNAVTGIGNYWSRTKELAAEPVRYTIGTVFNGGLVGMWNSTNDLLDTKRMSEYAVQFATGTSDLDILPGYTPGRDPHTFVEPNTGMSIGLSGGESIMRPEVTKALGTARIDSLNAAARSGGTGSVRKTLGQFANGGVVESITDLVNRYYPGMSITSTYRNTSDNHGAGKAVDFSNGTDSTPEMRSAAQFFYKNYGRGLLELIHSPFGNNVKDGRNVGDGFGFYGAGTMGGHRNHVHVAAPAPLGPPGSPIRPVVSGAGVAIDMGQIVSEEMAESKKKFQSAMKGWNEPGLMNTLPKKTGEKLEKTMMKIIDKKAEELSTVSGGLVSAAGVNGTNKEMGKQMAARAGWSGGQWSSLDKLWTKESQWDNLAQNPSSTAYGIPQFLDSTWRDYGWTKTSDAAKQIQYGISYIKQRYGDANAAWGHSVANNWYDDGGYLMPGVTKANNETGKPEPVFTAEQWLLLRKAIITNFQNGDWDGVSKSLATAAKAMQDAFAKVDWEDIGYHVGNVLRETFTEGQVGDALGVFGIPSPDSIPLVKASKDLEEALQASAKEEREARQKAAEEKDAASREATKAAYAKANAETRAKYGDDAVDAEDAEAEKTGIKPGTVGKTASTATAPSTPVGTNKGTTAARKSQVELIAEQAAGMAAPILAAASGINPAFGAAAAFAGTAVKNSTTSNTSTGATYNIYANTVDEGMRRAQMHERQLAAGGLRK